MRRLRAELDLLALARLLPAAGVAATWTVLMFASGGFQPRVWLPAGLVLVGLLAVAVVGGGRIWPAPGAARLALGLLAAFTAWSFASIAWSDAPGSAWDAANLLLLTLLAAWTLALAPWRPGSALGLMVALSVAAAAACLVALVSALGAADLTSRFTDARFSPPLDYPNTTAAFAFMAAIPPLLVSARPGASIPAKALSQALATFLCAYALLPQSRGSILGGLAALAVLYLAVPFRWRLTLHVSLIGVALAAVAGPVGAVYTAAEAGRASPALSDAVTAILLATAAAAAAGLAIAVAEDRFAPSPARERALRRGGWALAVVAVIAVVAAGLARSGAIEDALADQWRSLKHPGIAYSGNRANGATGRLGSADPLERYDYWRVALVGFRADPVGGMGAGGFEHRYALERRYGKNSRYPHNLALKVLGDLGLVGVALLAAFLGVVARGLAVARRLDTGRRTVAAAAAGGLAYFAAHGQFDWLEAYPVLAGPALALPLVALIAVRPSAPAEVVPRPAGRALLGAGIVALTAALSLLAPWTALRYRERASAAWRTDPVTAYRDLDRAAAVNPLSPEAPVLLGAIALTRGDLVTARAAFGRAARREEAWLPHFGLGVVAAARRDRATAQRELARARALDPRNPVLPKIATRVLRERPVDAAGALHDVLVSPFNTKEPIS